MPLQYPYPENNWAVGKMRKRGEKNSNSNGDEFRVAMDVRRGRPELEEPGVAEAERLAGAGIGARGGTMAATRADVIKGAGGISPETIQTQKLQLQRLVADQLVSGNVDFRRVTKWAKDRNWTSVLDIPPAPTKQAFSEMLSLTMPDRAEKAAKSAERSGDTQGAQAWRDWNKSMETEIANAPAGTHLEKFMWSLRRVGIPFADPTGLFHRIKPEAPAQSEGEE